MQLDDLQSQAIDLCLDKSKRIVAITGPAGTGKTTIIRHVAEQLRSSGKIIAVCAPTGKAARRITEATGVPAVTMHRLLEYPRPGERDPDSGKPLNPGDPKRDHLNPLEVDAVIADEYAMVATDLDRNLIDALGRGTRLLTFGDVYQLPPIEPKGLVIDSTPFERHLGRASIALEHIYRQDEGSTLLENANFIRQGRMPRRAQDFELAFVPDPIKFLRRFVIESAERGVDYRLANNQIITPLRTRWIGTHAVNQMLRSILNHRAHTEPALELPRNAWDEKNGRLYVSIGDKVVCTENTYDMRNYTERYTEFDHKGEPVDASFIECPPTYQMLNGETGIVTEIEGDGSIQIDMGDRTVFVPSTYAEYSWKHNDVYDVDPRKRLELAYALTTHKCQGSEFETVTYVINKSIGWICNRKNTYTAVTRARKNVTFVCDQYSLKMSLNPYVRSVKK